MSSQTSKERRITRPDTLCAVHYMREIIIIIFSRKCVGFAVNC